MWATNAVNGVINIITKKASDTPGAMVAGGGGTVEQGFGTLQYGGSIGKGTSYRGYTKYSNQDHFPNAVGPDGGDGWNLASAGFRTDTVLSSKDALRVEGELYGGREGNPFFLTTSYLAAGTGADGSERGRRICARHLESHVLVQRRDQSANFVRQYQRGDVLQKRGELLTLRSSTISHGVTGKISCGGWNTAIRVRTRRAARKFP